MSDHEVSDEAKSTLRTLQNIERLLQRSLESRESEITKILELASVNVVFCVFIASIDVALLSYLQAIITARPPGSPEQWSDVMAMSMWFISIVLSINIAYRSCLTQKFGTGEEFSNDAMLSKSFLWVFKKPCCKWRDPCVDHRNEFGIPKIGNLDAETARTMPLGTFYFEPAGVIGDRNRLSREVNRLKLRGGAETSWISLTLSTWGLLFGLAILAVAELPRPASMIYTSSVFLAPNLTSETVFPWVAIGVDFIILVAFTIVNSGWALFNFGLGRTKSGPRYATV